MNRSRVLALALVATLGCAAVAQAQPTAPQSGPMSAPMHQRMEVEHAGRIKALHQALNIRPDQEAVFAAFAASMHPNAHDDWRKHDEMDRGGMQTMTTPQRMDHMAQMMDERSAHMRQEFQAKVTATKALYAALSPDQRHTLDALHDLTGHGGAGHDGHHHDHGPMGHGQMGQGPGAPQG